MLNLPKPMRQVWRQCETVFSERVWEWANILLVGAILAKGRAHGGCHRTRDGVRAREAIPA